MERTIGELTDGFNAMIRKTHDLFEKIQYENERRRHYELMLLQVQINPHFLYNTLDSLLWLIRLEDNENAEKMLEALIAFFRTSINKGLEKVTLKTEITNIKSYLKILSMRYQSKLTYSVYLEEELSDFIVPKLILQPLVENAIYHGIKKKSQGGAVQVECRKMEGKIWLIITDTGIGMSTETLNRLRRQLANGEISEGESYGLMNVNERLHMFYSQECGIIINSTEGEGTCMQIYIDCV